MGARRYDKGEKRYKHEGSGPEPEIHFDKNRPRKWIGKCPAGMPAQLRTDLLYQGCSTLYTESVMQQWLRI